MTKNEELLISTVGDYKKFDEVKAVVISGSSTGKTEDNSSDYDIYIYCTKEPDVDERKKIALKYSDKPEIDNHYFETGDVYYLKETGKPIDIMYRSLESIEGNIRWVWEGCNASLGYTTCFVYNVNISKILFDRDGWFKNLQEKTRRSFPELLAKNIVTKNFNYLKDVMFSYYDQLKTAVERGDYVSVNHRSAAFLASYFDIIFAMNKLLHPGEKKLVEYAKKHCKILPENFEQDVNALALGDVEQRLAAAEKLTENIRKCVQNF